MFIGFNSPICTAGTPVGAVWLGGTQSALFDGKPARVARIQSSGNHSFDVTFPIANVQIIALLGSTLPNGTVVSLAGMSRTVTDGKAWAVLATSIPVNSIAVSVNYTGTYDIGELYIADGIELPLQTDLGLSFEDATVPGDTIGLQPANVVRPYRRRWEGVIQLQNTADTFTDAKNLQSVARALMSRRKAAFIPMTATPATGKAATNQQLIDATATFGFAEAISDVRHVEAGFWTMAVSFVEIP